MVHFGYEDMEQGMGTEMTAIQDLIARVEKLENLVAPVPELSNDDLTAQLICAQDKVHEWQHKYEVAIKEERERCAKVAENVASEAYKADMDSLTRTAHYIADKIRSGE